MSGINVVRGKAAPLDQANVDTDQIIPKQFLTGVTRAGYGVNLFHDWRYLDTGGSEKQLNPEFSLNKVEHYGAKILLTRENFGCGSSREHAPWALADFGFKAIIATSFADIFYGNSINNQLLPVILDKQQLDKLFDQVAQDPNIEININLEEQTVSCSDLRFEFEIEPHHKTNLLKGLDAIGQTLELDDKIQNYESNRQIWL